ASDRVPVWDPGFAQAVLAAGGVPAEDHARVIVATFFGELAAGPRWTSPLRAWRQGKDTAGARDFVAYVGAHIALVPPVLATADAAGKVAAAQWFALCPAVVPPLAPMLTQWAVGPSKMVREAAVDLIGALPEPLASSTLADALARGTAANLGTVIDHAARRGEPGRALLDAALAEHRGGKRDELLAAALHRTQVAASSPDAVFEVPPTPPVDTTPLGDDFLAALEASVARSAASVERSVAANPGNAWARNRAAKLRGLKRSDLVAVRAWLNGERAEPPCTDFVSLHQVGVRMPLAAAMRASSNRRGSRTAFAPGWLDDFAGHDDDLRTLAAAAALVGVPDPLRVIGDLGLGHYGVGRRRPEAIWPFYAEHPEALDRELGLARQEPASGPYRTDRVAEALAVLAMFPTLPARYVPALAQFATGAAKTHRRQAQELLEHQPNALEIAAGALRDGAAEIRATAAAWIGRIGDPGGIAPLRQALGKERREQPQAAMLIALRLLGDDIAASLTPEVLASAAAKGLAAKQPASMAWFPLDALPACRWADGSPVEAATIRWWAVLAVKLKDPAGAGLIPLYVSLLDAAGRAALGTFVLDAWLAHDTRHPSDEECRAYATAHVAGRYAQYQDWAARSPQYYAAQGAMTRDQVFDELRREKSREHLGSAIGDKGLLALSTGAPGHHVFDAVQRYIRDHGQRRAQVEALIVAAAANDDPAAIQLVLSVARKFKQETVRLTAAGLAAAIAERRGWTLDELADRTIPTAGFDDSGVLVLDYGRRRFVGRVARSAKTGAFTIGLATADGTPVTALPKPGVADDEALAAESRKQLATSKKELAQVVTLQTSRLFEAMCLQRTWDAADW
ncbi:MAG: DUF4132 domain-containing protein, partial [Micrococcales bacterium]|nr:DUF4132 domain-containing protein [Micrococcales bacterium]